MEVSIVMGVPQNGWFIMEHPIKTDDLGVPLFQETSKYVFLLEKMGLVVLDQLPFSWVTGSDFLC